MPAMAPISNHLSEVHAPQATAVATRARRLIGLERHYHCRSCEGERRSWTRLASCPDCGDAFTGAVIRRAVLAG